MDRLDNNFYTFYWKCAKKYKFPIIIFVIVFSVLTYSVKTILSPYILKCLIDNADTLTLVSGIVVLFCFSFSRLNFLLYGLFKKYETITFRYVAEECREALFHCLLQQPLNYFESHPTGDILQKIDSIVGDIPNIVMATMFFLRASFTFIVVSSIICFRDLRSGLFFVIITIIMQLINIWAERIYSEKGKMVNDAKNTLGGTIADGLQNIINIKLFQSGNGETKILAKQIDHLNHRQKIADYWFSYSGILSQLIVFVAFMLYAKNLVFSLADGKISKGEVIFYLELMRELGEILNNLFYAGIRLFSSLKIFKSNLIAINSSELSAKLKNTTIPLDVENGKITFKGVNFSYGR